MIAGVELLGVEFLPVAARQFQMDVRLQPAFRIGRGRSLDPGTTNEAIGACSAPPCPGMAGRNARTWPGELHDPLAQAMSELSEIWGDSQGYVDIKPQKSWTLLVGRGQFVQDEAMPNALN